MRSVLLLNSTSGQAMTAPQQSNESDTTWGHVNAILQALHAHLSIPRSGIRQSRKEEKGWRNEPLNTILTW